MEKHFGAALRALADRNSKEKESKKEKGKLSSKGAVCASQEELLAGDRSGEGIGVGNQNIKASDSMVSGEEGGMLGDEEKEEVEEAVSGDTWSMADTDTGDMLGTSHEPCPDLKNMSLSSATALFTWIRRAPTLKDVNARLDYLVNLLPTTADYINNYLRPSMKYWALCCQVGDLTFGIISTSIQESIHSSFKAYMRNRKIPLHKLPEYFQMWFGRRNLNLSLKINSTNRLKIEALVNNAKKMGCETLSRKIDLFLTEAGKRVVLQELELSYGFDVIPITIEQAVIDLDNLLPRRGPYAQLFSILFQLGSGRRLDTQEGGLE
jgi:hypothetical protein